MCQGVAAARRYGRSVRHVVLVVSARGHLPARGHLQQVGGAVVTPRPGLAERRERAVDQRRVDRPERLVAQPQRAQAPRRERLQHHVGARREPPQNGLALRPLYVQRHAPLGRVVVPEVEAAFPVRHVVQERPDRAGGMAARRLDLHHVRAEVGHQLAAELPLLVRKLDHPKPVQRPYVGHVSASLSPFPLAGGRLGWG